MVKQDSNSNLGLSSMPQLNAWIGHQASTSQQTQFYQWNLLSHTLSLQTPGGCCSHRTFYTTSGSIAAKPKGIEVHVVSWNFICALALYYEVALPLTCSLMWPLRGWSMHVISDFHCEWAIVATRTMSPRQHNECCSSLLHNEVA